MQVRLLSSASIALSRSGWNWQTGAVLKAADFGRKGSSPFSGTDFGDEREMESGLIFNQLICEFESRHPCHIHGRMLMRDYI